MKGEQKFINGPGHMTKMDTMPIYGKNYKKSSSLEPMDRFQQNWYVTLGTLAHNSYINHDL